MKNDPIVNEIYKVRAKMLDACNGDLEKLMDQLKEAPRSYLPQLLTCVHTPTKESPKWLSNWLRRCLVNAPSDAHKAYEVLLKQAK